ncbi:sensor histidine kinase [Subtercola boreus]|uniref:Histidine kinase/HSP90-like ATPase domain-containing protein n=1 Tax=Subtercola boreus TaxID=120213 RepID=A0A3E0WCR2_9MICO|nr:ATP-binding protein [Subtercola boreus]RFA22613.1 hypothetical protein B7R24_03080 [Subtercola boreus]RFA22969.1 hypothetical protein B7R23_03075 [Subtercola boreus]RFA28720.1 hypothetical protein B7R25_03090 [Subtercola boreus]
MSAVSRGPAIESTLMRLRGAISRARVERILTQASALFCLVFAVQTIPSVAASSVYLHPTYAAVIVIVLYGLMFVILVTSVVFRRRLAITHIAMSIFTVVYLLALAFWPVGLLRGAGSVADQPWLWYLITIAMTFAAMTFSLGWAVWYIVFSSAVYVFIRTQPAGGAAHVSLALIDGFYVVLLGAFSLAFITALRAAADRVDAAQSTAMEQYAGAARNHAAELERLKVDSLVHDTVLSTLIFAARAETPGERELAVALSAAALETLQEAPDAFDPAVEVSLSELSNRLADAAQLLSPRIVFPPVQAGSGRVPGRVAEAVFTAAQQALINSLQHAGDLGDDVVRTLLVRGEPGGGFTVQVSDTGRGFDVADVPRARLGLRVSIRERVESVGGRVRVQSVPGGGTSVILEWGGQG